LILRHQTDATTQSAAPRWTDTDLRRAGAAVVLLILVSIGALLRLHDARESLWLDELHTAWTVSGSIADVSSRAQQGNQHPLYFYMPWVSTRVFGMTELTLRLPSLITGILAIPLAFIVIWKATGALSASLLGAAIVTISREFIRHAHEARVYSSLQLIALLQLMAFSGLMAAATAPAKTAPTTRLRIHRALFVLLSATLFYLHYTSVFLIVAEVIVFFVVTAIARWPVGMYRPLHFASDLLLLGVACFPTALHAVDVFARRDNWSMFVNRPSTAELAQLIPAATLFAVGATLIARADQRHVSGKQRLWLSLTVGCWGIVIGLSFLAAYSGLAPLFHSRYLAIVAFSPVVFLGICASLASVERLMFAGAVAMAITFVLGGIPSQYARDGRISGQRVEHWRDAVGHILQEDAAHPLPVLIQSGLIESEALSSSATESLRRYSLLPVTTLYSLERSERLLYPLPRVAAPRLDNTLTSALEAFGEAWLISRPYPENPMAVFTRLCNALDTAGVGVTLEAARSFGAVFLLRIRVAGDGQSDGKQPENCGPGF
jgi:hypothetical protein